KRWTSPPNAADAWRFPMQVNSREYKVIADTALFVDPDAALKAVAEDLGDLAQALRFELAGEFDAGDPKERTIRFLDTSDFTLRTNGLLLRERVKCKNGKTEYTLKCRNEDRYIAAGKDLNPAPGLKADTKFEEDVGVPFVSRFSQSTTISLKANDKQADEEFPATLGKAANLFPVLLSVQHDGSASPPATPLTPVNSLQAFERVYKGPILRFHKDLTPASVAVIVWQKGKHGRLLTAEFSFRYEDEQESFSPKVASAARRC